MLQLSRKLFIVILLPCKETELKESKLWLRKLQAIIKKSRFSFNKTLKFITLFTCHTKKLLAVLHSKKEDILGIVAFDRQAPKSSCQGITMKKLIELEELVNLDPNINLIYAYDQYNVPAMKLLAHLIMANRISPSSVNNDSRMVIPSQSTLFLDIPTNKSLFAQCANDTEFSLQSKLEKLLNYSNTTVDIIKRECSCPTFNFRYLQVASSSSVQPFGYKKSSHMINSLTDQEILISEHSTIKPEPIDTTSSNRDPFFPSKNVPFQNEINTEIFSNGQTNSELDTTEGLDYTEKDEITTTEIFLPVVNETNMVIGFIGDGRENETIQSKNVLTSKLNSTKKCQKRQFVFQRHAIKLWNIFSISMGLLGVLIVSTTFCLYVIRSKAHISRSELFIPAGLIMLYSSIAIYGFVPTTWVSCILRYVYM